MCVCVCVCDLSGKSIKHVYECSIDHHWSLSLSLSLSLFLLTIGDVRVDAAAIVARAKSDIKVTTEVE